MNCLERPELKTLALVFSKTGLLFDFLNTTGFFTKRPLPSEQNPSYFKPYQTRI